MIKKVINSYDIHINGQQLRIVHKNELAGIVQGFDNIDLLLNEPRGSKYVNLIIYEIQDEVLNVDIHTNSTLDNKDILLKSFICSLLDRGSINQGGKYVIKEKEEIYTYIHDSLELEEIYEVENANDMYVVNDKYVRVEAVDFELSIENITELKKYVETYVDFEGYLILTNRDAHAVINGEKNILAYPIIEAISMLNQIFNKQRVITLNTSQVKIEHGEFLFQYYLISNSQFYIDGSDIYSRGFLIK